MIARTKDLTLVMETMEPYMKGLMGFHPEEWLRNDKNICLTDTEGNISLFEDIEGIPTGHYFFSKARGRAAVRLATEMLNELFNGPYDVKAVRGLTPLETLGAKWVNKQLGFTSHGVIDTANGLCELFILTKQEWNKGKKHE